MEKILWSAVCTNYIGRYGKLDSRKRQIPHSLNRTQLIYTCILLSFSQSLMTDDSWAEVQRFMIPKFLKQRFMILTSFETMFNNSSFRFHPRNRSSIREMLPEKLQNCNASFTTIRYPPFLKLRQRQRIFVQLPTAMWSIFINTDTRRFKIQTSDMGPPTVRASWKEISFQKNPSP